MYSRCKSYNRTSRQKLPKNLNLQPHYNIYKLYLQAVLVNIFKRRYVSISFMYYIL